MSLDVLKEQRENYVTQLQQVEKSIERTEMSLVALRNQMEQLKGAVFAADQALSAMQQDKVESKPEDKPEDKPKKTSKSSK